MAPSSMLGYTLEHFQAQYFWSSPVPTRDYSGQTIIVTGSNTGIGLETARWFAKLNAAKVILAVRTISKGEAVARNINASLSKNSLCKVEVWELDLASSFSVKAFAARVDHEVDRLDVLISNAGVYLYDFTVADDNETTVTVNVINTLMLAFLSLPKLRETSVSFRKETKLTFTGSFTFWMTAFTEHNFPDIFSGLADKFKANMDERYFVTKLVLYILVRELAEALDNSSKPGDVIATVVNPGHVRTDIMRHMGATKLVLLRQWQKVCGARTPEQGGRILVNAADGGKELHGKYATEGKIGNLPPFLQSQESYEVQKKMWAELATILESKHPGIMGNI